MKTYQEMSKEELLKEKEHLKQNTRSSSSGD